VISEADVIPVKPTIEPTLIQTGGANDAQRDSGSSYADSAEHVTLGHVLASARKRWPTAYERIDRSRDRQRAKTALPSMESSSHAQAGGPTLHAAAGLDQRKPRQHLPTRSYFNVTSPPSSNELRSPSFWHTSVADAEPTPRDFLYSMHASIASRFRPC